jgi:hypothetical protein
MRARSGWVWPLTKVVTTGLLDLGQDDAEGAEFCERGSA